MVSNACKKCTLFGCGTFLLLAGAITGGLWGIIYSKMLNSELVLTNSSRSFQIWKDIPIPIYMEIYMFNWTNPEEVLADPAVKPHFVEMGPYVFREYHKRVNISWNSNDTVTYQQVRSWHFQPDKSNGTLGDNVTNINVVASTVAYQTRSWSFWKLIGVNGLLKLTQAKVTVTKTVREFLFDGYDDKLLDAVRKLKLAPLPFSRFGYFVEHNNSATADGIFNMLTGKSNLQDLGLIQQWNFQNRTGMLGHPCDTVRGSSGDLWPPFAGNASVQIFSPDLCFALPLSAAGETEAQGLPGKVFVGDERTLDNGTHFPEAKCQCVGECQPYGTLNVSSCRFGSPLFVSFPHFFLADPAYREPLDGMRPNGSLHRFSLTLQPETGMPLHVEAKLQLNVMVKPWKHISLFNKVPQQLFVPTLWFAQRAELPEDLAGQVHTLISLHSSGYGILFSLAGLGVFLLVIGLLVTWRHGWGWKQEEDTQPLVREEPSTPSYGTNGSVVG